MKTLKTVEVKHVYVDYMPDVLEEGIIYISELCKVSIHNCLCGCGEETVLPLMNGQWTLLKNGDKISFTPSIGNFQFACKSHYIITNNKANFV